MSAKKVGANSPSNYVAITNDGRYVLIFEKIGKIGKIYVLDTELMRIRKSKQKMKKMINFEMNSGGNYGFQAAIPSNTKEEQIVTRGFIRNLWKKEKWREDAFPCVDVIQFISSFYQNEYLYLIDVADYDRLRDTR